MDRDPPFPIVFGFQQKNAPVIKINLSNSQSDSFPQTHTCTIQYPEQHRHHKRRTVVFVTWYEAVAGIKEFGNLLFSVNVGDIDMFCVWGIRDKCIDSVRFQVVCESSVIREDVCLIVWLCIPVF